ncbi:hypothetical protein NQ315_013984 [Exocentrus adspersus]|uniref:Uncharacterized protein n=1 Tax=Exocentrus adspersus TaxID=1586481 RepID=A0AAV8VHE6_9CUCU|nr:hypothetical protein NQ315_013984 [Exocentrus adspersus]
MLTRLLELKKTINLYIVEHPGLTDLTYHEWQLSENLINLLKPFEEITKLISSQNSCISEVIPFVSTLKAYLTNTKENNFSGVGTMKDQSTSSLNSRFRDMHLNNNLVLATYLDPRFKDRFLDDKGNQIKVLKFVNQIREMTRMQEDRLVNFNLTSHIDSDSNSNDGEMDIPLCQLTGAALTSCSTQSNKGAGETTLAINKDKDAHVLFWESYDKLILSSSSEKRAKIELYPLDDEINIYRSAPIIKRNEDPFKWWASRKNLLPGLFSLMQTYLSAPGGSCSYLD